MAAFIIEANGSEIERREAGAGGIGIDLVQVAIAVMKVDADTDARLPGPCAAAPASVQHVGVPAQGGAGGNRQRTDVLPVAQFQFYLFSLRPQASIQVLRQHVHAGV